MQETSRVFVGLDTSKLKNSVALAEEGARAKSAFSATSTTLQTR
jgi:hypothetical protein